MQVKASLDQAGVGFVHDKALLERDAACPGARCRPDFQVKHDAQGLVDIWVEVDEHQHRDFDCECTDQTLRNFVHSKSYQDQESIARDMETEGT